MTPPVKFATHCAAALLLAASGAAPAQENAPENAATPQAAMPSTATAPSAEAAPITETTTATETTPSAETTPAAEAMPATETTPATETMTPAETPHAETMTPAETTQAAPLSWRRSGIVAAARRVRLGARMDAAVSALHAREGERYRQGDMLVEFDCSVERAALEEARIAFQLAKLGHKTKKREYENREITEEQAEMAALQSEAALAALNRMRERVKYCAITAPFDARVIKVFAAEHEEVAAYKPVVEIAEDTALQFHLLLPWAWLQWLSIGDEFDVRIAGRDYRARLKHLAPEADPVDKSLAAVARILDADDRLVIGMSGAARFNPPGGAGAEAAH